MRFVVALKRSWPFFALVLAVARVVAQSPSASPQPVLPQPVFESPGRITRVGVARAQAVVDSVFLDRRIPQGFIDGGDWASYLMARLGVEPLPENTAIAVVVDSTQVEFSSRLQDLPPEARRMFGPLEALVDSSTVLTAEIVQLPAAKGIAHFQLKRVLVGSFPGAVAIFSSRFRWMDRSPWSRARSAFASFPRASHDRSAISGGKVRARRRHHPRAARAVDHRGRGNAGQNACRGSWTQRGTPIGTAAGPFAR
jgi:hypothetical protein